MNIDWQMLALNVQRKIPLVQASKKIGRNKGFVSQLARGEIKEPHFTSGVHLLNLHLDLCGKEKHQKLLTRHIK